MSKELSSEKNEDKNKKNKIYLIFSSIKLVLEGDY
jgi:hypothetical protein